MQASEAAAILRGYVSVDGICASEAMTMGAEALELLAWMEEAIGNCAWTEKSWQVVVGTPSIVHIRPGKHFAFITYETLIDALRAARKADGK